MAAAALNMSQSSVSEGLQALEQGLGRPLLRRRSRGVELTDAGKRALDHARLVLEAAADLHLAVNEPDALKATLTVATFRSLGVHVLPRLIAMLRSQHPELKVDVLDADGPQDGVTLVQISQADLGLLQLPASTPLMTWPLMRDEYLGVFPASRGQQPVEWAELTGQPFFQPGAICSVTLKHHFDLYGQQLPAGVVVEQDDVRLSMVEHGLGFGIMPRLATLPLPAGVVALPLPVRCFRTLGVVVKPGRSGLPHIAAFKRVLETLRPAESRLTAAATSS